MPTPTMTIEGRLVADPELRFTPKGAAVASFTIAASDRKKEGDEWVDGDKLFMPCSVWKQAAENVVESLQKGDLVIATGKVKQRSYETKDGEKRTVVEMTCWSVAPSLAFATAKVNRARRGEGGTTPAATTDPWASTPPPADEPPFLYRPLVHDLDFVTG